MKSAALAILDEFDRQSAWVPEDPSSPDDPEERSDDLEKTRQAWSEVERQIVTSIAERLSRTRCTPDTGADLCSEASRTIVDSLIAIWQPRNARVQKGKSIVVAAKAWRAAETLAPLRMGLLFEVHGLLRAGRSGEQDVREALSRVLMARRQLQTVSAVLPMVERSASELLALGLSPGLVEPLTRASSWNGIGFPAKAGVSAELVAYRRAAAELEPLWSALLRFVNALRDFRPVASLAPAASLSPRVLAQETGTNDGGKLRWVLTETARTSAGDLTTVRGRARAYLVLSLPDVLARSTAVSGGAGAVSRVGEYGLGVELLDVTARVGKRNSRDEAPQLSFETTGIRPNLVVDARKLESALRALGFPRFFAIDGLTAVPAPDLRSLSIEWQASFGGFPDITVPARITIGAEPVDLVTVWRAVSRRLLRQVLQRFAAEPMTLGNLRIEGIRFETGPDPDDLSTAKITAHLVLPAELPLSDDGGPLVVRLGLQGVEVHTLRPVELEKPWRLADGLRRALAASLSGKLPVAPPDMLVNLIAVRGLRLETRGLEGALVLSPQVEGKTIELSFPFQLTDGTFSVSCGAGRCTLAQLGAELAARFAKEWASALVVDQASRVVQSLRGRKQAFGPATIEIVEAAQAGGGSGVLVLQANLAAMGRTVRVSGLQVTAGAQGELLKTDFTGVRFDPNPTTLLEGVLSANLPASVRSLARLSQARGLADGIAVHFDLDLPVLGVVSCGELLLGRAGLTLRGQQDALEAAVRAVLQRELANRLGRLPGLGSFEPSGLPVATYSANAVELRYKGRLRITDGLVVAVTVDVSLGSAGPVVRVREDGNSLKSLLLGILGEKLGPLLSEGGNVFDSPPKLLDTPPYGVRFKLRFKVLDLIEVRTEEIRVTTEGLKLPDAAIFEDSSEYPLGAVLFLAKPRITIPLRDGGPIGIGCHLQPKAPLSSIAYIDAHLTLRLTDGFSAHLEGYLIGIGTKLARVDGEVRLRDGYFLLSAETLDPLSAVLSAKARVEIVLNEHRADVKAHLRVLGVDALDADVHADLEKMGFTATMSAVPIPLATLTLTLDAPGGGAFGLAGARAKGSLNFDVGGFHVGDAKLSLSARRACVGFKIERLPGLTVCQPSPQSLTPDLVLQAILNALQSLRLPTLDELLSGNLTIALGSSGGGNGNGPEGEAPDGRGGDGEGRDPDGSGGGPPGTKPGGGAGEGQQKRGSGAERDAVKSANTGLPADLPLPPGPMVILKKGVRGHLDGHEVLVHLAQVPPGQPYALLLWRGPKGEPTTWAAGAMSAPCYDSLLSGNLSVLLGHSFSNFTLQDGTGAIFKLVFEPNGDCGIARLGSLNVSQFRSGEGEASSSVRDRAADLVSSIELWPVRGSLTSTTFELAPGPGASCGNSPATAGLALIARSHACNLGKEPPAGLEPCQLVTWEIQPKPEGFPFKPCSFDLSSFRNARFDGAVATNDSLVKSCIRNVECACLPRFPSEDGQALATLLSWCSLDESAPNLDGGHFNPKALKESIRSDYVVATPSKALCGRFRLAEGADRAFPDGIEAWIAAETAAQSWTEVTAAPIGKAIANPWKWPADEALPHREGFVAVASREVEGDAWALALFRTAKGGGLRGGTNQRIPAHGAVDGRRLRAIYRRWTATGSVGRDAPFGELATVDERRRFMDYLVQLSGERLTAWWEWFNAHPIGLLIEAAGPPQ